MRQFAAIVCALALSTFAQAWDGPGHRLITRLALDGLPDDAPAWLKDPALWDRMEYQSSEPDRWRGTRVAALSHVNGPDHYIDVDDLEKFNLTLQSVPKLRYQYVSAMTLAHAAHPERFTDYDASADLDATRLWPGFVMHAMAEHHAKLRSSFHTLRVLESLDTASLSEAERATRVQHIEMARANATYHIGMLSHFVGDTAQPLHTTRHHHGWVGENPHGYTTDRGFHAYIDGTIVKVHQIDFDSLRPALAFNRDVSPDDPWDAIVAHVERSFAHVETLYQMHKDGRLTGDEGKALISERLGDGATMLSAMIWSAWVAGTPDEGDGARFLRFEQ